MRRTQTTRTMRGACVGAVLVAAVAASMACGSSGAAIVMYDASLQPVLALQLRDGDDKPLRIIDAFDVDGDVVVAGERVVGQDCNLSITDGTFGFWPEDNCTDIVHGFIARIERDSGNVKWMLAASGDENISSRVTLWNLTTVNNGGVGAHQFRVSICGQERTEIGGRSGSFEEWLDVDDGTFLGADPAPEFPIYDDVAFLDDGSVVGTFEEATKRGTLNENGVIVEAVWENAGHEGIASRGAVHVIEDEVFVAWEDGSLGQEMRLSVLSLEDGREIETHVVAACSAKPSARGWWTSPPFVVNGESMLQHRDGTGTITAEREVQSTHMLSGTHEELWLVDESGTGDAPDVVAVMLFAASEP